MPRYFTASLSYAFVIILNMRRLAAKITYRAFKYTSDVTTAPGISWPGCEDLIGYTVR